ncbi:MAG: hypothetical protein AAGJ35_08900, partial [Myxococcota bacterium]
MSSPRPFLPLIALALCASSYLACGFVPTSTEPSQTTQGSRKKQESSEEQYANTQKPDAGTERISDNDSSSNDGSSQETEESVQDKEHACDASTPTEQDEDSARTEQDEDSSRTEQDAPDATTPTEQPPEQTNQPPPGFTLETWCAQSGIVQGQWISQLSKGIDPKSDYICKKSMPGGLQKFILALGYSYDDASMLGRLASEGKGPQDRHFSLSELHEGTKNPFITPKHKELIRKTWDFFRVPPATQTKTPPQSAIDAFKDKLSVQIDKQKRHALGNGIQISKLPQDLGILATQLQQQFNQDGKDTTIHTDDIQKLFATASTDNDLTRFFSKQAQQCLRGLQGAMQGSSTETRIPELIQSRLLADFGDIQVFLKQRISVMGILSGGSYSVYIRRSVLYDWNSSPGTLYFYKTDDAEKNFYYLFSSFVKSNTMNFI